MSIYRNWKENTARVRDSIEANHEGNLTALRYWRHWLNETIAIIESNSIEEPEHKQRFMVAQALGLVEILSEEDNQALDDFLKRMKFVQNHLNKRIGSPFDEETQMNQALALFLPLQLLPVLHNQQDRALEVLNASRSDTDPHLKYADEESQGFQERLFKWGKENNVTIFQVTPYRWLLTTEDHPIHRDIPLVGNYCILVSGEGEMPDIAGVFSLLNNRDVYMPYIHALGEVKSANDIYIEHRFFRVVLKLAKELHADYLHLGEFGTGVEEVVSLRVDEFDLLED